MSATAWAMASGYASAGLLCLKVAVSRPTTEVDRMQRIWAGCAFVLALLAVLAVWRLDLVLGDWLRQALRASGWYPLRRPLQAAALLASLWLGWVLLREALPPGAGWPLVGCVLGTGLLSFVGWGRLLSWHTLDGVLNFRWVGVSTGRWMELLGLLAVLGFAMWQWRDSAGSR